MPTRKACGYRYYTSHALLQRRNEHAGTVPRVSAPEVEALVCEAVRGEKSAGKEISDKDLIARHVSKVIVRRDQIDVEIRSDADRGESGLASMLQVPFLPTVIPQKGRTREPADNGRIDAVARERLLNAITRASRWVEAVRSGEAKSFYDVAAQEGLGERHVRWLAPLAFVSPKLLSAVLDQSAPKALSIAQLAKALPHSWSAQDKLG